MKKLLYTYNWIVIPAVITVLLAGVHSSDILVDLLQYKRSLIRTCDAWRLYSSHFVHWSWGHLAWDGLTFFVTGIICMKLNRLFFFASVVLSPLVISLYIFTALPGLELYRGISGIDLTLFTGASFLVFEKGRAGGNTVLAVTGLGSVILMVAKIIYENVMQSTVFVNSTSSFILIPGVHIAGLLSGVLIYWVLYSAGYRVKE